MQSLFNNTKFAVGIEPEFYGKTPGEMNRINNNQNSIKQQIKQQTTQTKLTSLFTKWDEENDSIKELFKQQETIIKKNGGQNVKQW